jgi:hypothetical protein
MITTDSTTAFVWDSTLFHVSLPANVKAPFSIVWEFDYSIIEQQSKDSARFAFSDTGTHHVTCTLKDSLGNLIGTGVLSIYVPGYDISYLRRFTKITVRFAGAISYWGSAGDTLTWDEPIGLGWLGGRLISSFVRPGIDSCGLAVSSHGIDSLVIWKGSSSSQVGNQTAHYVADYYFLSAQAIPFSAFQKESSMFSKSNIDSKTTQVKGNLTRYDGPKDGSGAWMHDTLKVNWQSMTRPPFVTITFHN